MSDIDLIDLSLDDKEINQTPRLSTTQEVSSNAVQRDIQHTPHNCDFVSAFRRDSLENNPFDLVQKLANRPSDPFDIVESQVRQCSQNAGLEVKVGNLLSLSNYDENEKVVCENTPNQCLFLESKMKETEPRKRLLKFSITNSTFNTPTGRSSVNSSPMLSEESEDSPMSHMFKSAISHCSAEPMLSAESPLKFVDDDLMCESPPFNLEADFDADLKMLTIPILKDLPLSEEMRNNHNYDNSSSTKPLTTSSDTFENLEILRSKLRARRSENKFNNDITGLIQNLKSLICDGDLADGEKKLRASSMLETLSKTLAETQITGKLFEEENNKPQLEESDKNLLGVPTPPPSIKRQGTFDLNILEAERKEEVMEGAEIQLSDAMTSSTATYDGDGAADKMGFEIPEIEAPMPRPCEQQQAHNSPVLDINDIVEQLSKLLNISHFPTTSTTDGGENLQNCSSVVSNSNPTFIVVMPSSNANALLMEESFGNHGTTEHEAEAVATTKVSAAAQAFRRRSQSLSLHDKLKIVQLPLPVTNLQQAAAPSPVNEYSPPTPMPLHMLAAMGRDVGSEDFKTPARMLRRNSYSSGTPYTPMSSHGQSHITRRSNLCNEIMQNPRRSTSIMENQVEKQKQQQPQPSQRQAISTGRNGNLPSRLNLRKKPHKSESIMKSCAPMKATIPLKKIMAPILKTSPPTPIRKSLASRPTYQPQHLPSAASNQQLDNTMNFMVKNGQIALTSTPMPLMHNLSALTAEGPLSFCSTPHVGATRNRSNMTRPRLSYAGATPTSKAAPTTSASTAALSRRTIMEFKHKSPMKTNMSSMAAVGRHQGSARSSNSTTAAPANTVRSGSSSVNRTVAAASSSKAVSRLRAPAHNVTPSVAGTSSGLNKENKRP